jgi:hypothetical protein
MRMSGAGGSYDFCYFGLHTDAVQVEIARWCAQNQCRLDVTPLLDGVRFHITGPGPAIRAAIPMTRKWIRIPMSSGHEAGRDAG